MADDIDTVCKRMVADANAKLAAYEKEQVKAGNKKPNSMRTFLSANATSGKRDAKTQAEEVLAGRSWTCNSSHVADAARHVGPRLNGKPLTSMGALKKATSKEDYDKFVEIYGAAMQKQGLRNYRKGEGFLHASKDPLHMELLDSRLPDGDSQVRECERLVEEARLAYANATRVEGKTKNQKFERNHRTWLEAWDKKHLTLSSDKR
jgi:hypothetical protein